MIIIGTGAGGGTLARHLAPSGKRILLLERGDWLPREPQNWLAAGRVRRQPLRLAGHLVRRRTASRSSRRSTTSSAARRSSTARRSTGCARRTSASFATTTASRRPGRSPTTSSSPTTRRPSSSTRCTARAARIPTEAPASAPYPFPPVSHEPRIQQLADDLAAAGYHPFHAPCGIMLNEANMPYSACVRCQNCDGFPCLVHAKSDAEVLGVRPALEHPNVTLLTNAKVVRLETNAPGTAVTERRRRARRRDGALRRRHRRGRLRRRQHGQAAARLGERQAPERARQRLRPGRAQLHVPRQPGRARALARGEPDRLPEDARAERLLLRQRRLRLPARQHPDGRQVAGADVPRREADRDEARAGVDAGEDRAARDRLLALDRGPAACPRTASPSTATATLTLALHADERRAEAAALRRS